MFAISFNLINWMPVILNLLVLGGAYIFRDWLKVRIEQSIHYSFGQKIERIRADLQITEEQLKSELRVKETQLAAVTSAIVSGQTELQSYVNRRKVEATERIWARVTTGLVAYKAVASSMAVVDLKALQSAAKHPGVAKFASMIIAGVPENDIKDNLLGKERIFVSDSVWAYFQAYQSILYLYYTQAKLLSLGVADVDQILDAEGMKKIIKSALPHRASYIDENPSSVMHTFVEELEELVFNELRRSLDGQADDSAIVARVVAMTHEVRDKQESLERQLRVGQS